MDVYHYTSFTGLYQILVSEKLILSPEGKYGEGLYFTDIEPPTKDAELIRALYDTSLSSDEGKLKIHNIKFYLKAKIHLNALSRVRNHQFLYNPTSNAKIIIVEIGERHRSATGKRMGAVYAWTPKYYRQIKALMKDRMRELEFNIEDVTDENTDFEAMEEIVNYFDETKFDKLLKNNM
jgi:hypothetical protein